ncbi:MAG: hypothetical protein NTY34_06535 [Candidatus Omnitrophica bacterium]|nr:hypothetical protein [Candidatus Omnitrophota bacterium]
MPIFMLLDKDGIPHGPLDVIVESFETMPRGSIVLLVVACIVIVCLITMVVHRQKYLPKSETVKYMRGYPGLKEWTEGVIEILGDNIVFKEFCGVLNNVVDVKKSYSQMGSLTYWAIGVFGSLAERGYLTIKYKQGSIINSLVFSVGKEGVNVVDKLKSVIDSGRNRIKEF